MKNHLVIFCENTDPRSREIAMNAKVFCVPFLKIQEAMEFCELEEIHATYIGFKNNNWKIDPDTTGMSLCIKVTRDGIHESNKERYVWVFKKINLPQGPYMPYQYPALKPPNFLAYVNGLECN